MLLNEKATSSQKKFQGNKKECLDTDSKKLGTAFTGETLLMA